MFEKYCNFDQDDQTIPKSQVSKDGATLMSFSDASSTSVNFTESSDLYFGLRGAGASLGIVTEFLYTVHPHPETKAVILLVLVTKVKPERKNEVKKCAWNTNTFGLYSTFCFKVLLSWVINASGTNLEAMFDQLVT